MKFNRGKSRVIFRKRLLTKAKKQKGGRNEGKIGMGVLTNVVGLFLIVGLANAQYVGIIDKWASQSGLTLYLGQQFQVNYEVRLSQSGYGPGDYFNVDDSFQGFLGTVTFAESLYRRFLFSQRPGNIPNEFFLCHPL